MSPETLRQARSDRPLPAVQINSLFEVDITIKGIPNSFTDNHGDFTVGGIASVSLDLYYDPAVLQIVGEDPRFILQALGSAHLVDNSDSLPDTNGRYHVGIYDSSNFYEYGDGVLVRLTFQAKSAGTATIFLGSPNAVNDKPKPADALNTIYDVTSVKNADVHVGSLCPTPTPTPTPSPTPDHWPDANPNPVKRNSLRRDPRQRRPPHQALTRTHRRKLLPERDTPRRDP